MTGNTLDEELVAFETAGADLAISKPLKSVDLEELLSFLNRTGGFQSQFYNHMKIIMTVHRNSNNDKIFEWKPRTEVLAGSSKSSGSTLNNWFMSSSSSSSVIKDKRA